MVLCAVGVIVAIFAGLGAASYWLIGCPGDKLSLILLDINSNANVIMSRTAKATLAQIDTHASLES